jgi:hypothetical protein
MDKVHVLPLLFCALFAMLVGGTGLLAAGHKPLPAGCLPVTGAGACDQEGKTYVLTQDVRSATSGLFLANHVTLDLNGYTLTYADGDYQHVPNYGFEEGLAHWDLSHAPSARTEDTDKVKPFIGKKILRLAKGEEIVSEYITLPVAKRSYYAMCGVTGNPYGGESGAPEMQVTISVDDAAGQPLHLVSNFGDKGRQTCPQTGSPELGGGFVFAWLHDLPAGRYRIRVRAETDALIDEVDIRPAMDVGIGLVNRVAPWSRYQNVVQGDTPAFADYGKAEGSTEPQAWIPRLTGPGTITIRNGTIRSGAKGIRSWGILSSADGVKLVLENVKIVASGLNTNAVNVPRADLRHCRFEIDTPFIINRHMLVDSPVALTDVGDSEVSHCEFIGGQGNLMLSGKGQAQIHDNLFVNRQTVTNHYSLMLASCEGARIYRNRFAPEIGSGITIFSSRNNEVAENSFEIVAANGSCEYTDHTVYSTNAIRITDYDKHPGDPTGAFGNRIHHNRIHVVSRAYPNYEEFVPLGNAIFSSVGAGTNYVEDNDITIEVEPGGKADGAAFYVSERNGGEYRHNRITTNVPAAWIGNPYGPAANTKLIANTITKTKGAPADFKPFRLGWWHYGATGTVFEANQFVNCEFGVQSPEGVKVEYERR